MKILLIIIVILLALNIVQASAPQFLQWQAQHRFSSSSYTLNEVVKYTDNDVTLYIVTGNNSVAIWGYKAGKEE